MVEIDEYTGVPKWSYCVESVGAKATRVRGKDREGSPGLYMEEAKTTNQTDVIGNSQRGNRTQLNRVVIFAMFAYSRLIVRGCQTSDCAWA